MALFMKSAWCFKIMNFTSIVGYSGTKSMTVEITIVQSQEVVKDMKLGVLYHLRYTYPVIDGGYLNVNGTPSIVFIQIYRLHHIRAIKQN